MYTPSTTSKLPKLSKLPNCFFVQRTKKQYLVPQYPKGVLKPLPKLCFMRKFYFLLISLFFAGLTNAQTTIFSENFDGAWTIPSSLSPAWSSVGTTNTQWQMNTFTTGWTSASGAYSPTGSNGTTQSARFHSYDAASGSTGDLITPTLDFSAQTGNKLLTFYTINLSGTDNIKVSVSTDGGATYGSVLATTATYTIWTQIRVDLGNSTSNQVKIKFTGTSDFGTTDIGLDQVVVTSCSSAALPAPGT